MTKSQEGQANFVIEYLKGMRNGYFLDIGAYDGVEFSNTYDLEKTYDWTGVLAECDISVKVKDRSSPVERKAVWSKSGEKLPFKIVKGAKLSGIISELSHPKGLSRDGSIVDVETISLNDLLVKYNCPKHINYMSMDIEGAEYQVLSAFDFTYTFDVISVEHIKDKEKIYDILQKNNYVAKKEFLLGNETIFVRKGL